MGLRRRGGPSTRSSPLPDTIADRTVHCGTARMLGNRRLPLLLAKAWLHRNAALLSRVPMANKKRPPARSGVIKRNLQALCDEHGLTPAERTIVMELGLTGSTNGEIARALGLSPHTVNNQLKMIHVRMGTKNREQIFIKLLDRVIDSEVRGR